MAKNYKNSISIGKSRFSNSYVVKTTRMIFPIKVLIDSLLSVEESSKWNSLTFLQASVSWVVKNAKKCTYYCYFADIETHNSLKLPASYFPRSFQSTLSIFYFVKNGSLCEEYRSASCRLPNAQALPTFAPNDVQNWFQSLISTSSSFDSFNLIHPDGISFQFDPPSQLLGRFCHCLKNLLPSSRAWSRLNYYHFCYYYTFIIYYTKPFI